MINGRRQIVNDKSKKSSIILIVINYLSLSSFTILHLTFTIKKYAAVS
jgi:hypothetical protein